MLLLANQGTATSGKAEARGQENHCLAVTFCPRLLFLLFGLHLSHACTTVASGCCDCGPLFPPRIVYIAIRHRRSPSSFPAYEVFVSAPQQPQPGPFSLGKSSWARWASETVESGPGPERRPKAKRGQNGGHSPLYTSSTWQKPTATPARPFGLFFFLFSSPFFFCFENRLLYRTGHAPQPQEARKTAGALAAAVRSAWTR